MTLLLKLVQDRQRLFRRTGNGLVVARSLAINILERVKFRRQQAFPSSVFLTNSSLVRSIYYLNSEPLEGTGMGHYCRVCGRERPNEAFSGKGHKIHVCKRCKTEPTSERQAFEEHEEIFDFMHQSHISQKNVARLTEMAKSENTQVANLAAIVLEVARVTPYKRRRLKFLTRNHRELLHKLEETGLVYAHNWDWVPSEIHDLLKAEERGVLAAADEPELQAREDSDTTDSWVQEDWEIPF